MYSLKKIYFFKRYTILLKTNKNKNIFGHAYFYKDLSNFYLKCVTVPINVGHYFELFEIKVTSF